MMLSQRVILVFSTFLESNHKPLNKIKLGCNPFLDAKEGFDREINIQNVLVKNS